METRLRRRWILNFGLALLAVGLLLVMWWRPGQPPPPPPLTTLKPADIRHVIIHQPQQPAIELVRDQDRWRMVKPVAARLNTRVLDQLLWLASAPVLSQPGEGGGLAAFGLEPPRARVRLNETEIDIGVLHPVKGQIYVRHGGRSALVPAGHAAVVSFPWNRLLDHRLLGDDSVVRGLQLPGFAVVHQPDGWQRRPADRALSSDRINAFVQEWQHATALAVDPATRKPAVGKITLTIRAGGQEQRLVLEIVSFQPELVLRRRDEGLEYHFPEDVGRRLTVLGNE